ncbi:MAG: VWA domain-containing protein [Acidobacteria bacterium]|nr:MAG: VWA domain-containing protein [Acidobacteriota bacterium]REK07929.1 MAG: VWA domain-containing protein [Acidobacteriota bacterium]
MQKSPPNRPRGTSGPLGLASPPGRGRRIGLPMLGLLAVALLLAAASSLAQRRQFDDTTTVTLVEVPVQVVVDGDPLKGLTKDNFEIVEGRKKQDIVSFEMVDLSVTEQEVANTDIPVAARRHFLALFDLSSTDPQSIVRAQKAASELVLDGLHPTDLVAVATYSQSRGPQLVLGFTPDRNQIRQAFYALGVVEAGRQANVDPLGLVVGDLDADPGEAAQTAGAGFDAQAELQDQRTATAHMRSREAMDQAKNDLAAMTSSLEAIAGMLAAVEGRKHVLFLSEGFDSSVLTGTSGMSPQEQQRMMEEAAKAGEGRTWEVDNDARFGNSEAQGAMRRMADAFQAADAVIQTIDIGGLVAGTHNKNADGLFYMANETGGEMFTNYNNLGSAMQEMLQRTSVTYLLGYQPKDLEYDGKFRNIEVKLKNAPRGARVTHRPGYYPTRPYDQQSPMERRLRIAQKVVGGEEGGAIGLSALATPFPVPGQKSYVPVLLELEGQSLTAGQSEGVLPVEIYAYAQDSEGTVRDFFARPLGLDVGQTGPLLKQTGLKYFGHLDLNPGEYTLRVLVRNAATGASGLEVTTLEVPDTTSANLSLVPPLAPEPIGTWVLAREEEGEQREGVEFPFMMEGQPFLPAAHPTVAKGGTLPLYLFAHNAGAGSLTASAQVITADGDVEPAEISLANDAGNASGVSRLAAEFQAGSLAPGEYTLLVTVRNLATSQQANASLPIRIGG